MREKINACAGSRNNFLNLLILKMYILYKYVNVDTYRKRVIEN